MVRSLLVVAALSLPVLVARSAGADVCAPVSIGWTVDPPVGIAVADDGNVYWLRTPQPCQPAMELVRTPKHGGPTTRVALLPASATKLAVAGNNAFVLAFDTDASLVRASGRSAL